MLTDAHSQGNRNSIEPYMRKAVQQYGFCVISADYRFAPQVGVADIFEDVKDCIAFIRNELSARLDEDVVDVSHLAVSGSSAGGYLALLAGLYVEPKPDVIAPIYPITDPLGTFFTNPQPPAMGRPSVSKDDIAPYLDPKADVVANCGPGGGDKRTLMYIGMMEAANLADLLGIRDPETAAPWRVSRNIQKHCLPPAYILHGDSDTAVGVEQADEVVGAAIGCGLEVIYERPHGKDHFLDAGADYQNGAMFEFIVNNLTKA